MTVGLQIISQLFYHNSDMTDCERLLITYIGNYYFLFTPHTLPHHSGKNCEIICGPKLFH